MARLPWQEHQNNECSTKTVSSKSEQPIEINRFSDLENLYRDFGIAIVYVKHLARKQDNDKNQIYFGSLAGSLTHLLPNRILPPRHSSTSTKKRQSRSGEAIVEAQVEFFWIDRKKHLHLAPHTKLIDYFQYPEMRMSGFLKDCANPPDSLRRTKLDQYGKRILTFGVSSTGEVLGFVLTEKTDSLVANFPELPQHRSVPMLRVFSVSPGAAAEQSSPKDHLCVKLKKIVAGGWHPGLILRAGSSIPQPYKANNAGGMTIEALLGIPANSNRKADLYDYEIKTYKTGKTSLITTHPDSGRITECDFRSFMKSYGWPDRHGKKTVFNGQVSCNKPNKGHGWELTVKGYDPQTDRFCSDPEQINVLLRERDSSEILCGWSFVKLMEAWTNKHAQAVYIKYQKSVEANNYRYDEAAYLCHGTDWQMFLRALIAGVVLYDPGHELSPDGITKTRHQWKTKITASNLAQLYHEVKTETLT